MLYAYITHQDAQDDVIHLKWNKKNRLALNSLNANLAQILRLIKEGFELLNHVKMFQ